jgi:hypothetical protein
VKLGAATYSPSTPFTLASSNSVMIVGQGAGQTLLTLSGTQTNATVLSLSDSHASLTSVGIVVPAGSGNTGLSLFGEADAIAITGPQASSPTGVALSGTLLRSSIALPASAANQSTGVSSVGFGTVEDSSVTAHRGVSATGLLGGVTMRHDTLIGDGGSGSVGISAAGEAFSFVPGTVSVAVDDSIVRGFATDLSRQGAPGDPMCISMPFLACPVSASITFGDDDFDTGAPRGVDTGPGSYTDNGSNKAVDPSLVNPGGSPADFHLLYSSPLIDAGMTTVESGESTQDEDGNPRKVGAATDIGAYEYQRRPPVIGSVSVTPPSAPTGTPFSFSGSATDPDPGDTVTLTWSFDDGASGSGALVHHAFGTRGAHIATLTATDPTGLTATASTAVTAVTATSGGAPRIGSLSIRPAAFAPAPSGGSIATAKTGATVSYADTQVATTTFIVQRAVPGVQRGRRCVKPSGKKRRGKRCTLYAPVAGSFRHSDTAGVNRVHFTGRIRGAALSPGGYRLRATPRTSAGTGATTTAQFQIIVPRHHRR